MKIKKEYVYLSIILFIALVLRLIDYDKYAFAFYDEGIHAYFGLVSSQDLVLNTLYQPPVLFQIYGFFYSLFDDYMIFRLINIFFSVLSIFLLFIWSRKHFSSKESLIACLLLSTTLIHIEHSHFLNQDSLLFCLGMSSLIFIDLFKDKKNILYLIISGAIIGIGIFTKYTFILFFGFCIIYLFFFYKMRKLRTYYYFFVGVAASSLLFLLPHIILMFSNPNSPYSLINFFNLYGQESGFGSGGMRIENLYYYASKIFNVFGVGLFLIIYKIFKRDKNSELFFIWIIYYFIALCFERTAARYFFMQGLGLVPLIILISSSINSLKKIGYLFLFFIILYNSYSYWQYVENNQSFQNVEFRYINNENFKKVVEYINQNAPVNSIIMTNEPYLFLYSNSRFPITSNYEPHISCPNPVISYLILVNSSLKGFGEFDINFLYANSQYYIPEKVFESSQEIFYIFKVKGNENCKNIVPPLKEGFYLSDLME